jgi:DNA-binding LytR/AlgR family response regulator
MRDFANLHVGAWLQEVSGRVGMAMIFAAALAFLGPFETSRFDVMDRVGYWTVLMIAFMVLSQSATWLLWQAPAVRRGGIPRLRIFSTLVAAPPMIVVIGVANNMMHGWSPNLPDVLEFFVAVMFIGVGYTYLSDRLVQALADGHAVAAAPAQQTSVEQPPTNGETPPVSDEGPTDTALIERLPQHIRGEILCLQVEDHYVRVHSRQGSAMVLMRFSDALRGVDHIGGSQVHRSWWVATNAVQSLRRTGRTAQLTLCNGLSVPVSQPYLAYAARAWGSMESSVA